MSKFGGGIGAPSKEERLKEAADIHLRLGQIQRYCELMVELGQVRYSVCVCECVCSHFSLKKAQCPDTRLVVLALILSVTLTILIFI